MKRTVPTIPIETLALMGDEKRGFIREGFTPYRNLDVVARSSILDAATTLTSLARSLRPASDQEQEESDTTDLALPLEEGYLREFIKHELHPLFQMLSEEFDSMAELVVDDVYVAVHNSTYVRQTLIYCRIGSDGALAILRVAIDPWS